MSFSVKDNIAINTVLFTIAFGLLIASGSFYRYIYNYNLIMLAVLLLISAIIFYKLFIPTDDLSYSETNLNYSGLILITSFIFVPILSDVYNQVVSYEITYFHIVMLFFVYLIGSQNREKILKYYLYWMVLLASVSLIYFTIELFSEIPSSLPYYGTINVPLYSKFFYFWSRPASEYILIVRNQSIFWEPGAFGFHLIIATALAYKLKNKYFIFILLLTCITTLSTTVYIFMVLLFLYQILFGENKITFIGFSIFAAVLGLISMKIILGDLNIIKIIFNAVYDKFSISSAAYQSFYERTLYTVESLKLFLDNIFLGAGHYSTATELTNTISETSGLAGLMAELGILGIIIIILYMRFFRYFKLVSIPIALVWLNGEYMQYTPIALFILTHMVDDISNRFFPELSITKKLNKKSYISSADTITG